MTKLAAEFATKGNAELFRRLQAFLTGDPPDGSYETLAGELGTSASALRTAVHRMRRRFRKLVRAAIAETVATTDEIDEEIRFLFQTLRSP
jgi:hypothetical protein